MAPVINRRRASTHNRTHRFEDFRFGRFFIFDRLVGPGRTRCARFGRLVRSRRFFDVRFDGVEFSQVLALTWRHAFQKDFQLFDVFAAKLYMQQTNNTEP